MKAIQFQHFPVCTPVETFHPEQDDATGETTSVHSFHFNDKVGQLDLHDGDIACARESLHEETLVEPFQPESDDDSLKDNLFLGRVNLSAVTAC